MRSGRTVRTYGRRQPAPSSPPGLVHAPSSSGSLLFTPPSSPSPKRKLRLPLNSDDTENDDGDIHIPSSPTRGALKRRRGSPPTPLQPLSTRDINRPEPPSQPLKKQATLKGFFAPIKRARVSDPGPALTSTTPRSTTAPSRPVAPFPPAPRLHQLQFMSNAVQTCQECFMSYLRGTDDADHKRHHTRVTRGIPWKGRKEVRVVKERISLLWGVKGEPEIEPMGIKEGSDLGSGDSHPPSTTATKRALPLLSAPSSRQQARHYRILTLDASLSGVIISDILSTVDTVLAAPALPPAILERCKLFLAVTSCEPPEVPGAKRRPGPKPKDGGIERVVAVVVSQPIKWAMRVLREGEEGGQSVDSGDGVICDPTPLPTPLGIHRLFTVPAYRGCGLAAALLHAAATETVYGCSFDPTKGEIAFSQPTESGKRVMEKWGGGAIRVFCDDERQL